MLLFVSVDGPVPDAKKPFFPVLKNVGVISTSCDSCGFPKNSSGARQFQTCAKSARAMLVSPRSRRIAGTSYVQVQMPAMCGVSRGITVSIIRITPAGTSNIGSVSHPAGDRPSPWQDAVTVHGYWSEHCYGIMCRFSFRGAFHALAVAG